MHASRQTGERPSTLPAPLDCETAVLLRQVLLPILDTAPDWDSLKRRLSRKGYAVSFRRGHMVIVNTESGAAISTAGGLGTPLRALAQRLGRPALRMSRDGLSAEFHA